MAQPKATDPNIAALNMFKETPLMGLQLLSRMSPKEIKAESVEGELGRFQSTLLGGGLESELDEGSMTLLTQGRDLAKRIMSRLQAAEKKEKTPGVQAQTRIANRTSLLG